MTTVRKYSKLLSIIRQYPSAVIAYSGGLDSAFLAWTAAGILGRKVLAVTAAGPTLPAAELADSRKTAQQIGVQHLVIKTGQMRDPLFLKNGKDRCYHCKAYLFRALKKIAVLRGYACVFDGANASDSCDARPGAVAAKKYGVISPMAAAGLTKPQIRRLAQRAGLRLWDKPAAACLASRVPFKEKITRARLARIEAAETLLKKILGPKALLRARDHGKILRIEAARRDLNRFTGPAVARKITGLKRLGYKYITLDLEGYIPAGLRNRPETGDRRLETWKTTRQN